MARQYATADEYRALKSGAPNQQYQDVELDSYLQVATANVEQFCERIFEQQTYTEDFVGTGRASHLVYQYPIISVTSATQNTLAISPVQTAYDTDRFLLTTQNLASGRLLMDGLSTDGTTTWSGDSRWSVVYEGGFAEIPPVVKHATLLWTSELLRPDYAGVRSDAPEIIPMTTEQILELLEPLRRRRL